MLRVKGNKVVDSAGQEVVLRGYNVGNWMMMENFMLGYPGSEEEFRAAVRRHAGEEAYQYFFDRFLDAFLGEADIAFLAQMGVNCIRVPFNYRHFESDNAPFSYDPRALERLDALVGWCKKHRVYILLDLHAVQGYQSQDWHCDNKGVPSRLYTHAQERERFYRLWEHIAAHYRGEEIIAAYDLINEPNAIGPDQEAMLNEIYRTATERIRKVDADHIIVISGNNYGKRFESLEPPFAENLIYTSHYYLACCTSTPMPYPGELGNIDVNRALLEHQMDCLDAYMRQYNVPCWVGEFGVRLNYEGYTEDRLRAFADQLDVITKRGHHYSIWSYKDIGYLSTATVRADSPWMAFVRDTLDLKVKYAVDKNFRVNEDWGLTMLLDMKNPAGLADRYGTAKDAVAYAMKTALATELCDRLGRKFAGLSKERLAELADSFAFHNCDIDQRRVPLIQKYGALKSR